LNVDAFQRPAQGAFGVALVGVQGMGDDAGSPVIFGVRIQLDVLNATTQLVQTQRDLKRARYDFLLSALQLKAAAATLTEEDVVAMNGLLDPAQPIEVPTAPVPPAAASASAPVPSTEHPVDARRAAILAVIAALVFGVGLVASGRAASLVPVAWVALSARIVGMAVVVLPLLLQGRLRVTRAALPLVLIAGFGEIFGSMLSAWGSRESIAITAVMGSQFAAFAAVAAFLLFGERLGRLQVAGVTLIAIGVTVLAAATA